MNTAEQQQAIEFGGGRPRKGYYLPDGTRVPSVTTVLGRFKESGGLIGWAWKQGRDGTPLHEARQKAADIGSAVHAMVESDLAGEDPEKRLLAMTPHSAGGPDTDFLAKARRAYGAYREWWETSRLRVVACEVPLVSEVLRIGGTMDAIMVHRDGRRFVADWKTSRSVYLDHYLQLCAYGMLWEECRGERIDGAYLLRFSKGGSFHFHGWSDEALLQPGMVMYRLLARAYHAEKACKGVM